MLPHAITPVQQFAYTKGKNATDMAMVIDAMDLLYSNTFDGFCIVSSDSDFTRLASRIRENGLTVFGFGQKKTPESFRKACDKFIYTENLSTHITIESDEEKTQVAVVRNKRKTSSELKQDTALINLIRNAVKEHADDDGWTSLGVVGQYISKVNSDFDSRNYGYPKLSYLINAIDLFETQMHGNHLWLRLKKHNSSFSNKSERKEVIDTQINLPQNDHSAPLVITIPTHEPIDEGINVSIAPAAEQAPLIVQVETKSTDEKRYDYNKRTSQIKSNRGRPRKELDTSVNNRSDFKRDRNRPAKVMHSQTKSGKFSSSENNREHYWNRLVPLVQKAIERTGDIEGWATVSSVARELVTGEIGFNAKEYGFDNANNAIAAVSSEWVESRKVGRGLRVRVVKPYDIEVDGNTIPSHELNAKKSFFNDEN